MNFENIQYRDNSILVGYFRNAYTMMTLVTRHEVTMSKTNSIDALLASSVKVVNIGLREFAADLKAGKTSVIQVEWSPPVSSNPRIAMLLAKMGA